MVRINIGTRISLGSNVKNILHTSHAYIIRSKMSGNTPVVILCRNNNDDDNYGKRVAIYHNKNGSYIRTPKFLKKYIGKTLLCYNEVLDYSENEICRLRPLDFVPQWLETNTTLKNIELKIPRLTSSGRLFIPQDYVNKYFDDSYHIYNISSLLISKKYTNSGLIALYVTKKYCPDQSSKSLRKSSSGLWSSSIRTININDVVNFKYQKTMPFEDYEYGIMLFKHIDKFNNCDINLSGEMCE